MLRTGSFAIVVGDDGLGCERAAGEPVRSDGHEPLDLTRVSAKVHLAHRLVVDMEDDVNARSVESQQALGKNIASGGLNAVGYNEWFVVRAPDGESAAWAGI
jgi:hypothetical protein